VARIILVFIILLRGGWFTLDRIPLEHSRAHRTTVLARCSMVMQAPVAAFVLHAWSWRQMRGACYGASGQKPTSPAYRS
jgi:hypothetical protein